MCRKKPHPPAAKSSVLPCGCPYTDLACESEAPCSYHEEERVDIGSGVGSVTVTRRRETNGTTSVTVACGKIAYWEADLLRLARFLARELRCMAEGMLGRPTGEDTRVLVVGVGNAAMTPDSVGPGTLRRLTATRHFRSCDEEFYRALGCCELAALSPGVLGQTGMESWELVKCAADLIHPDLLVAVDALAARSLERLVSTVQLTDGGMTPGSGVGNHPTAIDRETVGCPVLGIGVPTVVDSATLILDALKKAGAAGNELPRGLDQVLKSGRSFIVSPADCDETVEVVCRLLAKALDIAFGVGE